ncbi:MAG: aspartate carbamoyltransferase catalytic subunit [Planctomycetota bacterium]
MPAPAKRDLVSIDDLSVDEVLELFRAADEYREDLQGSPQVCRGSILATLFFEPSTRTRLSFESAMQRLGGSVIAVPEGESSSQSKGESLADTVRVVGGAYADLLVIRHPRDGAAKVAARYAKVPVINGGDGAHEHPTQTLCDLYTLWKEKGRLEGLDVVLCGDLRYSRTVPSLAYALARFKANVITIPYPGFEMPAHVLERLQREFGVKATVASVGDLPGIADSHHSAAYLTASKPHQLALFTKLTEYQVKHIDAIYMTRAQRERHPDEAAPGYPRLSEDSLRAEVLKDASVMHPLPRTDEIAYELDSDPRSIYFRQAEFGVPIRMALMAFLLGKIELKSKPPSPRTVPIHVSPAGGLHCRNERCISRGEGLRYLRSELQLVDDDPPLLACAYCGSGARGLFIGNPKTHRYHRYDAPDGRRIKAANRVYFESEEQARVAGYRAPGRTAGA